jgi:hypothetical protein
MMRRPISAAALSTAYASERFAFLRDDEAQLELTASQSDEVLVSGCRLEGKTPSQCRDALYAKLDGSPLDDPRMKRPFISDMDEPALGFSYGPLPVHHVQEGGFHNDDMSSFYFRGQWSIEARNDFGVMKQMGANMVRLYGRDPSMNATEFLDTANMNGLRVLGGVSQYPYMHQPDNNCHESLDCYEPLREWYEGALSPINGSWLLPDNKTYHPALDTIIIQNEPELEFKCCGGPVGCKDDKYLKAVLSAFDGILSIEKEHGMDITSKDLPRFTVAVSYAQCEHSNGWKELVAAGQSCCFECFDDREPLCSKNKHIEETWCKTKGIAHNKDSNGLVTKCFGLPMMYEMWSLFQDPSKVGYTFKTVGWQQAFKNRWMFSINAFVNAETLQSHFLEQYIRLPFNSPEQFPIILGEYGNQWDYLNPAVAEKDIKELRRFATELYPGFKGFNVFQFQVANWKPCGADNAAGQQMWIEFKAAMWDQTRQFGDNWERGWKQMTQSGAEFKSLIEKPEVSAGARIDGKCTERLFGVFDTSSPSPHDFDFGPKVSSSAIQDPATNAPLPIMCLRSTVPLKSYGIAEGLGGKDIDSTVCRGHQQGWAKQREYCVMSRGWRDEDVLNQIEAMCKELTEEGRGFNLDCKDLHLNSDLPVGCDDMWGQADYMASLWADAEFQKQKQAGGDPKVWEICDRGGFLIWTPYVKRKECTITRAGRWEVPPEPTTTTTTTTTVWEPVVDDKVEAIYAADNKWYWATIKEVNGDGTFMIEWDDDDPEQPVKKSLKELRKERTKATHFSEWYWEQLTPEQKGELRAADYTKQSFNSRLKKSLRQDWDKLSDTKRGALQSMGYNAAIWKDGEKADTTTTTTTTAPPFMETGVGQAVVYGGGAAVIVGVGYGAYTTFAGTAAAGSGGGAGSGATEMSRRG